MLCLGSSGNAAPAERLRGSQPFLGSALFRTDLSWPSHVLRHSAWTQDICPGSARSAHASLGRSWFGPLSSLSVSARSAERLLLDQPGCLPRT